MATLVSTNITTLIAANGEQPLAADASGLIVEYFRATGGAAADTIVLTPRWITNIVDVSCNYAVTDNLSITAANTNVTLTLQQSAASTSVNTRVRLIGRR